MLLAKLQTLFQVNASAEHAPERARVLEMAAAALLIEVSKADFQIDEAERRAVINAMRVVFKLGDEEIHELTEEAERTSEDATSFYGFTRVINDQCSHDEKLKLLEQFWRIAYADGRLDKYEDHRIRRISELLHLSHREFVQMKLKVLNEHD